MFSDDDLRFFHAVEDPKNREEYEKFVEAEEARGKRLREERLVREAEIDELIARGAPFIVLEVMS